MMESSFTYMFDDEVSVLEVNELMAAMETDGHASFPASAVFHYPLRTEEKEQAALDNGINVTARSDQGELVGYLRVVSDRAYIHYIVDVMVRPDLQGQRIGSDMVKLTLNRLKEAGFIKVLLTALPGKEEFYQRLGFKETMSPVLALRGEDYSQGT